MCAFLSPVVDRPSVFVQGPSDSAADYDADCVGYPVGDAIPDAWWTDADALYDTTLPGRSNQGHETFVGTPQQRQQLITFLKTL